jgi:hypothetical protein
LYDYRVVYFATHALVAGEVEKFSQARAEPALVLSIPDKPTQEDDGLLRASDIAMLKLNADLVVLSACNTAADPEVLECRESLEIRTSTYPLFRNSRHVKTLPRNPVRSDPPRHHLGMLDEVAGALDHAGKRLSAAYSWAWRGLENSIDSAPTVAW